jgi:hypothetical protein
MLEYFQEMLNPNETLSVIIPETTLEYIDNQPHTLVKKKDDITSLASMLC